MKPLTRNGLHGLYRPGAAVPLALAAALLQIRDDPTATLARVEAGERRALALFSEDHMREGVLSAVREVSRRHGG